MFSNKTRQEAWEKAVKRGAGTWRDEWMRQAIDAARKAAVLTIAMAPAGYWTVGLLDKRGNWINAPEVDAVVFSMGVLEALYFLARAAHRVLKNGEQRGPAINCTAEQFYRNEVLH